MEEFLFTIHVCYWILGLLMELLFLLLPRNFKRLTFAGFLLVRNYLTTKKNVLLIFPVVLFQRCAGLV